MKYFAYFEGIEFVRENALALHIKEHMTQSEKRNETVLKQGLSNNFIFTQTFQ